MYIKGRRSREGRAKEEKQEHERRNNVHVGVKRVRQRTWGNEERGNGAKDRERISG